MKRAHATLSVLTAALVLAGCATVSPDGLRDDVRTLTATRLPAQALLPAPDAASQAAAQDQIAQWLRQPVDSDTAVRIALLNNPALQARLAALGVQDAQRVQALTLPNPHLSLGRFANGHEREIERQLSFGLLDLLTLPWRTRWQGLQIEQPRLALGKTCCAWPPTRAVPGCAQWRRSRCWRPTRAWRTRPRPVVSWPGGWCR